MALYCCHESKPITRIKSVPCSHPQQPFQQPNQSSQPSLDEIITDCNYTSRVEFGLKLGYTEAQVQIALVKLGPLAGQNELLAELIKLGAANNTSVECSNSASSGKPLAFDQCSEGSEASDELRNDHFVGAEVGNSVDDLRHVVIDGSNVAMSHGNKEIFSCKGIQICVDWFKSRGHKNITVFVPSWRKEASRPDALILDQEILYKLEAERFLVYTPSRNVGGRHMVCYDDRYILKLAAENDGIAVSNDNYRDLANENTEFKKIVGDRLLMYSFVNDRFMPPDDPLGRKGPSLENFLRRKNKAADSTLPPCPYGKKCTYGNKCKYYHPERGNQPQKTVTERLFEQAQIQLQEVKARNSALGSRESSPGEKMKATHTISLPPSLHISEMKKNVKKNSLSRTKSVTPGHTGHVSVAEPLDAFWSLNPTAGVSNRHSPLFTSNSCADLYGDRHPEHMFVMKRLSDPENQEKSSTVINKSKASGDGGGNLHRKLQRQLTINPTYDPRLRQMSGYQERCGNQRQPSDINAFSVTSQHAVGQHRQLNRLSSEPQPAQPNIAPCDSNQGVQATQFLSPFNLPTSQFSHPGVTRIASAPDSHSNWGVAGGNQIARLNSSSDTRLHLTPSPPPYNQVMGSSPGAPLAPFPGQMNSIWANSGSSGALSGVYNYGIPSSTSWSSTSWSSSPPANQSLQHSPATPTQKMLVMSTNSVPLSSSPQDSNLSLHRNSMDCDTSREKLYFHLSSIFPEEQVREAMDMYPDETKAQKICAAILAMFPKGSP